MAKQFFLTKWIKGWRLDKFFDNLFQYSPNGEITVKESAIKVIGVIDQTLIIWAQYEGLFKTIVSDDGAESADAVKAEILAIKSMLEAIETLPDISETLKDYRFADDDKRNDFYHSLVSTAALMFNDGKVSAFEAIAFVTQIAAFIKETK